MPSPREESIETSSSDSDDSSVTSDSQEEMVLENQELEYSASAKPKFKCVSVRRGSGREPSAGGYAFGYGRRRRECWTVETSQNTERPPENIQAEDDDFSSRVEERNSSRCLKKDSKSVSFKEKTNKNMKKKEKQSHHRRKKKQINIAQSNTSGSDGREFFSGNYNQLSHIPYGNQVPLYGGPQYGNPYFMPNPQPPMNVRMINLDGFYQGFQDFYQPNRGMPRGRGNMHFPAMYPFNCQPPYYAMSNMQGVFNQSSNGFNNQEMPPDRVDETMTDKQYESDPNLYLHGLNKGIPSYGFDHQQAQCCGRERDNPTSTQPVEPNTISLHGLNKNITEEEIRNYIEARTHEDVQQITISDDGTSAIITLEKLTGK